MCYNSLTSEGYDASCLLGFSVIDLLFLYSICSRALRALPHVFKINVNDAGYAGGGEFWSRFTVASHVRC